MQKTIKNILVSPLDWGLGHATRCVPIINKLKSQGYNVIVAASGRSLIFLQNTFPDLKFVELKGFSPTYSKRDLFILKLIVQLPIFGYYIKKENRKLKKILNDEKIDIIISDNRYGVYNGDVKSIIISHQLMIKMPVYLRFLENAGYKFIKRLLSKFDQVWVPDYAGEPNISGDLSHKFSIEKNYHFIGPLSRFDNQVSENIKDEPDKNLIVALISGSEPQRSILEEKIISQLRKTKYNAVAFTGKPELKGENGRENNIQIIPAAEDSVLRNYLKDAKLVICRSGYSSILDLHFFNSKALLIPTKGQTEQEYLARKLENSGNALWVYQNELNLEIHLEKALKYKGLGFGKGDFEDILTLIKN